MVSLRDLIVFIRKQSMVISVDSFADNVLNDIVKLFLVRAAKETGASYETGKYDILELMDSYLKPSDIWQIVEKNRAEHVLFALLEPATDIKSVDMDKTYSQFITGVEELEGREKEEVLESEAKVVELLMERLGYSEEDLELHREAGLGKLN